MALPDLTGQNIQDTYQRLLQVSSSGQVTDGTGSLVELLDVTASYAVSASHEITYELSSSYSETSDLAANATSASYALSSSVATRTNESLTVGTGLDLNSGVNWNGLYNRTINLDLTEVITDDGANRLLTTDGDGTLTGESQFLVSGTEATLNGNLIVSTSVQTPILKGDDNYDTGLKISGYLWTEGTNGHITASGNISASGTITAEQLTTSDDLTVGGDITAVTNITLGNDLNLANNSAIVSSNESNTYIKLNNDDYWKFNANGAYVAAFSVNGATFNENGGTTLNFRVESSNDEYALYIDAGNDTIELGRLSNTHVTASGNISSSGNVYANQYWIQGENVAGIIPGSGELTFGDGSLGTVVNGSSIHLNANISASGHITASGNISASGTIQGANLIATSLKTKDNENLIRYHAASDTVRVGIHTDNSHPLSLQGHVTASGDISASGDLTANNITGVTSIESTLYTVDGINAIDYSSDTHLFGSTTKFSKLRTQQGLEITAPVTASSHITAGGNISSIGTISATTASIDKLVITDHNIQGRRHILWNSGLYINDNNGLDVNAGYFGSSLANTPSNWNDTTDDAFDSSAGTFVEQVNITEDQHGSQCFFAPFAVSRIEALSSWRTAGTGAGEGFWCGVWTGSAGNRLGLGDGITDPFATGGATGSAQNTNKYIGWVTGSKHVITSAGNWIGHNNDIDYTFPTPLPAFTQIFFGHGTTEASSVGQKNTRGHLTLMVYEA